MKHSIPQFIKFCMVGATAAASHLFTIWLLVEQASIPPLLANPLAFLVAFLVSFQGQRRWTFSVLKSSHKIRSLYFALALFAFGLNESIVYLLNYLYHIHYLIAISIALVVIPPITYLLSKRWIFKSAPRGSA